MKETTKNIDISISRIADRLRGRSPRPLGRHSFFSVMIPLCSGADGEPSLLFEVRSSKLRHQPGDICFPGGKIEEGETPLECALREFAEETGIAASGLDVLGQFDTLYGFADYTLYTFVAELPAAALSQARPDEDEVAELFTVPLDFFVQNPPRMYEADIVTDVSTFPFEEAGVSRGYRWRKSKNIIPVYRWQDRVIWGMTARIVRWLVQELCAEADESCSN